MLSIDVLFDDYQFFNDSYTSIAEAVMLQHCEHYYEICRELKHLQDERQKPQLENQLLDEMDYFVHGRFERDLIVMCNGVVPISGNRMLYKLDELVEDEEKYPNHKIKFDT